ncbi:hypothetical protein [Dietzia sp. CH92]|uniref:hypothetical protein n=1 Tax=Dietzia sp. CH92 TaxID=3051823 RepID=UPI0028D15DF5|nr:hypothetical protein [Dietzia sp. CH92]
MENDERTESHRESEENNLIRKADGLNRRDISVSTIVDLPPYDDQYDRFSRESRELTVREYLGVTLPRPAELHGPGSFWRENRRKLLIGAAVYGVLTIGAFLFSRLAGELLVVLPILVGLAFVIWKLSRPTPPPPVLIRGLDAVKVDQFELRVVAHARNQVAHIMKSRAWDSQEIQDKDAVLDLGLVLDRLTRRSLQLNEFVSAADPRPDLANEALFAQWELERKRVMAARRSLLRELASLIEYREQIERVSRLMDQRDQANRLYQRSARLHELEADSLLNDGGAGVEDTIRERRTVEANLAAQISFLAEVASIQAPAGDLWQSHGS